MAWVRSRPFSDPRKVRFQALDAIGVSSGTMSAIWIVLGTILVAALVALAPAMR